MAGQSSGCLPCLISGHIQSHYSRACERALAMACPPAILVWSVVFFVVIRQFEALTIVALIKDLVPPSGIRAILPSSHLRGEQWPEQLRSPRRKLYPSGYFQSQPIEGGPV